MIISALFWKGYPRIIYDYIRERKYIMLFSNNMEKELIRVLGYPKFGLVPKEILPIIKNIRGYARFVDVLERLSVITSDYTDNIFIECAVSGKANYIVSGDKHLLEVRNYKGIDILKPRDFILSEELIREEL